MNTEKIMIKLKEKENELLNSDNERIKQDILFMKNNFMPFDGITHMLCGQIIFVHNLVDYLEKQVESDNIIEIPELLTWIKDINNDNTEIYMDYYKDYFNLIKENMDDE